MDHQKPWQNSCACKERKKGPKLVIVVSPSTKAHLTVSGYYLEFLINEWTTPSG